MKKQFLQLRSKILFMMLLGVFTFVIPNSQMSALQKADIPKLSLLGANNGYNNQVYSDGRIWLGFADVKQREILVPVFMQNLWWDSSAITEPRFGGKPIYSFSFMMFYDGRVMAQNGVQITDPLGGDITALAKNFEFVINDIPAPNRYRIYLTGAADAETKYGRRVFVTGTSNRRLPTTDENGQYQVLLYLKFKVTLSKQLLQSDPTRYSGAEKSPMYITNDSLRYGELKIGEDDPFPNVSQGDANNPYGNKLYRRDLNPTIGLAGININSDDYPDYPSKSGLVWVNVGENPAIGFRDVIGGTNNEVRQDENIPDGSAWNLTRPIVIDSSLNTGRYGTRDIQLVNSTARSRLTYVTIQSNAPWLFFRTLPNGFNPVPTQSREAKVTYIDNGINGPVPPNLKDARNNVASAQQAITMRVICNGDILRQNGEYAGVYVGYITLTSGSALISPVQLKVTFIYLRNPLEPYTSPRQGRDWGIRLTVSNSKGTGGESNDLIFGSGHRATDGVDSLFGEDYYRVPPTGYYARWFNPKVVDAGGNEVAPYGFSEIPIENEGTIGTRSDSRDIRDNSVDSSIIFLCRFNADGAQNYPIVISWDTQDFPDGAQLFLRDTLNGSIFSVDMRNATSDPRTPAGRSFTIRDARITSFLIEYTLPKVVAFPVINKGWNLLSLPVLPSDLRATSIYPNAVGGQPFRFYQQSYQNETVLSAGVGYFIKYGQYLDSKIAGTKINRINSTMNPVRLTPGWNTIGGLSVPVNVKDIDFDPYNTSIPNKPIKSVWGYRTDRGYFETSEIVPGLGYWIKVTDDGYLKLTAPTGIKYSDDIDNEKQEIINNSTKLKISDNAQHSNELYMSKVNDVTAFELPPVPPFGMFDTRFTNNANAENVTSPTVRFQGVEYPLAISIDCPKESYQVIDIVTGKSLGTINQTNSTVIITNKNVEAVKLLKSDTPLTGSMLQTVPNPTSGNTTVQYIVPQNGFVTVKVYNMLGIEVAMLVQEYKNADTYSVPFTSSTLPSGQYTVKMVAGDVTTNAGLTVIR
ncbi:MAG: T9SS type A sorting domain-containing protein [Bacteroidetes bacterium]|nr:T9SS type A sorting domain-containing protein [Bacteroidota bacterium]